MLHTLECDKQRRLTVEGDWTMQSKFEPWRDIRLDSNSIRPFIFEFAGVKWEIVLSLDKISEYAAMLKAYQQTQRAAVQMAAGAIEYNMENVPKGHPQMDVHDSKFFNKFIESDANTTKESLKEELQELISLCDKLKKSAEGLLESKYLEKTDYRGDLESACDKVIEAILGRKCNV